MSKCDYCGSSEFYIKKVYHGSIQICKTCSLGSNDIQTAYNYEDNTDFQLTPAMLEAWNEFARNDAQFIVMNVAKLHSGQPISILEIGSGYGLVSDYIVQQTDVRDYIHLEKNKKLSDFLLKNGKDVISSLKEIEDKSIDIIIMNHVLEHITHSYHFLTELFDRFPSATIVLLQTNHQGFIPKFFPYFWYGWQLNQHYYHFTPNVFKALEKKQKIHIDKVSFYKLPQKLSLSMKGLIKLFLKIINFFVPFKKADAFLIVFRKYA